jgi:hypothetical protein
VLDRLSRLVKGRKTASVLPTTEIYFTGPLGGALIARRHVKRIGQSAFVAGECGVIIRYASRHEIDNLKNCKLTRLCYLIDDNLFAAPADPFLPKDYRGKLTRFARETLPYILDIADEIVAPSKLILDASAYSSHAKSLLDPAYVTLCPDLSHFESPPGIDCIMLGTRSHHADIVSIASAVTAALAEVPALTITTFLGHHAPAEFRGHPKITNRAPLPWPAFREILQNERYHIALAPALPTDFNRARSISRILDHAAFGAAGIYTDQPPFSQRIGNNEHGILLAAGSQSWSDALISLANDLPKAKALAAAGRNLAERLGDPERVRRFWDQRFGVGGRNSCP